ncbi:MAG TPA: type II secretion system protein GspL [Burkholderiales bacterium]|nr:type II secretion system protein GspL [Burkholderiales bacterium]
MAKILMTTLKLYPDCSGDHFEWASFDHDGRLIDTGTGDPPPASKCDVILPASLVLLIRVQLPKANRRRQATLLSFIAEDKIISEPETNHIAQVGYFPDGTVALAVIEKSWLIHLLEQLKLRHLHSASVVPETLLPVLEPHSWALVWNGSGGFLRTGDYSGTVLDGSSDNAPPAGLKLALRGIDRPQKIVVHVFNANVPDIDRWSAQLGVDIERGDDWDWKASRVNKAVNLLQGEFGPKQIDWSWLPKLRPALIMLGLMLGLQFFGILADWALLAHEKSHLETDMVRTFRTSFPDASVVVDAPLQMSRKLAELRHAAGQQEAGDFLPLLAAVSAPLAALPHGALKSIDYEPGKLGLSIALTGAEGVDSMQKKLDAPHLKIRLEKQQPAADGSGIVAYFTISPENS